MKALIPTILTWLEAHAVLAQTGTSLILAAITLVYVGLTWRLLRENTRFRVASSRPSIIAYVLPHEAHVNLLYLMIENVGFGAAHRVKLTLSGKADVFEPRIREHGLFTRGITVFPPNARREVFLCTAFDKFEALKKSFLKLVVEYASDDGTLYSDSFELDFSQLERYEQVGKPPLYDIAAELERIRKAMEGWSTMGRRLQVRTYSPSDVAEESTMATLWSRLRSLNPERRRKVSDLIEALAREEHPKV